MKRTKSYAEEDDDDEEGMHRDTHAAVKIAVSCFNIVISCTAALADEVAVGMNGVL